MSHIRLDSFMARVSFFVAFMNFLGFPGQAKWRSGMVAEAN